MHGQDRAARDDHPPPRRAPQPDDAEVLRRGHAGARARTPPTGRTRSSSARPAHDRRRPRHGRADERPAAADRQGRRLGAVLRACSRQSLQTLGGSGFLQDYPIEQYIRDAKIDTLYEGTTAIQGLDFFFRKMVRDQFQALTHLGARDHRDFVEGRRGQRPARRRARAARQGARGRPGHRRRARRLGDGRRSRPTRGDLQGRPEHHPPADGLGDLIIGWLLLRQAEVALERARRRGRRTRTARSTRARSRPPAGSPATACRCSPPSAPSPRPPRSTSWTCRRRPSEHIPLPRVVRSRT